MLQRRSAGSGSVPTPGPCACGGRCWAWWVRRWTCAILTGRALLLNLPGRLLDTGPHADDVTVIVLKLLVLNPVVGFLALGRWVCCSQRPITWPPASPGRDAGAGNPGRRGSEGGPKGRFPTRTTSVNICRRSPEGRPRKGFHATRARMRVDDEPLCRGLYGASLCAKKIRASLRKPGRPSILTGPVHPFGSLAALYRPPSDG